MFDPIWILKQDWFAASPSPFSFAFYFFCGVFGAWKLLKAGASYRQRRLAWLLAFVDSVFLIGIVVAVQDTFWLVYNTVKWIIPLYSDVLHSTVVATFWNYYVRFPQNILGGVLMVLLTYGNFRLGWFRVTRKTLGWFTVIAVWMAVQFAIAPNQAWTDWMFAVSHGYPDWLILQGFALNVAMKAALFMCFLSFFSKPEIEESSISS